MRRVWLVPICLGENEKSHLKVKSETMTSQTDVTPLGMIIKNSSNKKLPGGYSVSSSSKTTCLVSVSRVGLLQVRASNGQPQNLHTLTSHTHSRTHLVSPEHYWDSLLFHTHSGVVAAALTAAAHSLLSETDMGTCPGSLFPSKLLFPKHRFLHTSCTDSYILLSSLYLDFLGIKTLAWQPIIVILLTKCNENKVYFFLSLSFCANMDFKWTSFHRLILHFGGMTATYSNAISLSFQAAVK